LVISKELLGIFNFASDVISFAMDENPEMIMIGFAPADFLLAVVAPELRKSIEESWDTVVFDLAEKAKDKGVQGINEFLQSSGGKEKRYAFKMFKINQTTLNKLSPIARICNPCPQRLVFNFK
jgi:hypothetical protein